MNAEARMAQLEKIAELARPVVTRYQTSPWEQDLLLLHLALVDLDNHPLTRTEQ